MSKRGCLGVLVVSMAFAPITVQADDITGAERLLCTTVQATFCSVGSDCEVGPPWNWNIPQFLEIDLGAKTVSTTKASGENRATAIKNLEREDGILFLQGVENRRAFSLVIDEATGNLSAAVAREEITVSVFGACTPMPKGKE